MINLTPHAIAIRIGAATLTIPPYGEVARVATKEEVIGQMALENLAVPVASRTFGEVTGLPPEGVPCLVSALVLGAVPGRRHTYAPDTGPTAIRDAKGLIQAVTRLIAA